MRKTWKEYFKDLHNIDTQEEVAIHMCGFDGIRRGNYFEGEPIERDEVEVTGKDEITVEMINCGGERVVGWIWRLCNIAFESGVVPEHLL